MKKIHVVATDTYRLEKDYEVDDDIYEELLEDASYSIEEFVDGDLHNSEHCYGAYIIRDENGNEVLSKYIEP